MVLLIVGLTVFFAAHSVRIVAEDWRGAMIARLGALGWKAAYSLVSLAGLAIMIWGYGATRVEAVSVWDPPVWTRHLAVLLTAPAFVLIAAAYVPGTHIKAALGHPMVLGVKLWALAHLLSNGRLGDILLFGAFLVWAVFDFKAARARDRAAGTRYSPAGPIRDIAAVVLGLAVWAIFTMYLHAWLIGVKPFA